MLLVIALGLLFSFLSTRSMVRTWVCKAPEIGLLGFDMNKMGKPKVTEMDGIYAVFGFVLRMLAYIGIKTFFFSSYRYVSMLSELCSWLMTRIIGMTDDILGWLIRLKQWQKSILTSFCRLPMMVITIFYLRSAVR